MTDRFNTLFAVLGPDRFRRLGAIVAAVREKGSLNAATKAMGVSYRQAWGLIKQAEETMGAPLLSRRVGGTEGGGAHLTDMAEDLLLRWQRVQQDVAQVLAIPAAPGSRPILLASTIGPVEVGLLDALEAAFHTATGLWVRHIAAGSGQALEIARAGRVDLVLTHSPAEEDRFISEGWGQSRHPLMRNDFVLCGPPGDPAGVRGSATCTEAMKRIAAAGAPFLSRADQSGTHMKELSLWAAAGVEPGGTWYRCYERGAQGSGITLRAAEAQGAYMLVDRAAYAAVAPARTSILWEGDPCMGNLFSLVTLNPERFLLANHEGARQFVAWATSAEGQAAIAAFGRFSPIQ
ncbi:MAG TPA: substrate-binding domain-containing protein [Symbiobacteriaceae bacterium]|nr:substrate-binding domain-containing protein [Symbiobacteriaceae bacterium]